MVRDVLQDGRARSPRLAISITIAAVALLAASFFLGRNLLESRSGSGREAILPADASAAAPAPTEVGQTSPAAVPEGVSVPVGMVYVPGGRTLIGDDQAVEGGGQPGGRHNASATPAFWVDVEPFFMDEHPVTVAQFRAFVEATGYRTEAERFGDAGVMDPATMRWMLVQGASWHHPFGPEGPAASDDHPVTQVSWNDAAAYASWAGKRLPTEIEWEHAARGARNARDLFAWGNDLVVDGRHRANVWQGTFPYHNRNEDGYLYTSPVGVFGKTSLGLTDMGGNVWEWCQDWYRPYSERDEPFTPDPASEKVQRGGSFQCEECHGFRVYTRAHSTPETALFHVGFRCVRDLPS